jgi:hypothetical protein
LLELALDDYTFIAMIRIEHTELSLFDKYMQFYAL